MTNNVNWKYLLDPEKTNKDKIRQIMFENHMTYWSFYLRVLVSLGVMIFTVLSSVFMALKIWN